MRDEARFVVDYVGMDGVSIWQDEHDWIPPMIGAGVELPDGKRYRIVDVWNIKQKRGGLEYGVHAFVEPVTAETDRLGNLWPDYYRR